MSVNRAFMEYSCAACTCMNKISKTNHYVVDYYMNAYSKKINFITETNRTISLYGPPIVGKNIYLTKDTPSSIYCETYTDEQEENATWYFGDANEGIQILNMSDLLFSSNQPRITTFTLTPTDAHHGMELYCCIDIYWKSKICSIKYNLFIKGIYYIV